MRISKSRRFEGSAFGSVDGEDDGINNGLSDGTMLGIDVGFNYGSKLNHYKNNKSKMRYVPYYGDYRTKTDCTCMCRHHSRTPAVKQTEIPQLFSGKRFHSTPYNDLISIAM